MGNSCMSHSSAAKNFEQFNKEEWVGLKQSHAILKMETLFNGDVRYTFVKKISEQRPPLRLNYVEFEVCESKVVRARWG